MLLHYKINHPIFILGDGIYSQELKTWIIDDGYTQIESVNHDKQNASAFINIYRAFSVGICSLSSDHPYG